MADMTAIRQRIAELEAARLGSVNPTDALRYLAAKPGGVPVWSVIFRDDDGPYVSSYATRAEADAFLRSLPADDCLIEPSVIEHFIVRTED